MRDQNKRVFRAKTAGRELLVLGQKLREPADVLIHDRAEHGQRLGVIAGPGGDLTPDQKAVVSGIVRRHPIFTGIPETVARFREQHLPGKEDGIERRVVDRLDTVLTLEPDEPEHFRPRPASFAVQQVTEFGPTLEQPAAALGAFFEPTHEHRRLVIPGRTRAGICPWPGDVKQLAAEVANLLEPPR